MGYVEIQCISSKLQSLALKILTALSISSFVDMPVEIKVCFFLFAISSNSFLSTIDELKKTYQCDVGYSGHESGAVISFAALMYNISSLERHITLDRTMYGSDQAASIEPSGFRMLVGVIRKIESAMGDGKIQILEEEIPIAKNLRQHLDWELNS